MHYRPTDSQPLQPLMPFSGNPLDRASNFRDDDAWVAQQLAAPQSRFLWVSKLEILTHQAATPTLAWVDAEANRELDLESTPVLLGVRDGVAHFAVDVSAIEGPLERLGLQGAAFAEPRGLATTLPAGEAGIVAQARSLLDWHARHRFCGACGGETVPAMAGSSRVCQACGTHFFPRIDPSVIMVVWRDDRCLLGRRRGRPPGSFSCLAGYIEQGETIEEAVAREVQEEATVPVDAVSYEASQPWPFPSTLMIGCFAHAASEDAMADQLEIEEVRWFSRAEVRGALAGDPQTGLTIPAPVAIAHHLIRRWSELES
jgi:NAD+ diphosphatase